MATRSENLRRARPEDVSAIAKLEVDAYSDAPNHKAIFPEHLRQKPGLEDQYEHAEKRVSRQLKDPRTKYIVVTVTNDSGEEEIAGCAEWMDLREKPAVTEPSSAPKAPEAPTPAYVDMDAAQSSMKQSEELLASAKPHFEGRDLRQMWTLNSLAVDEKHRRKGIGKKLTHWGIEQATAQGQDLWLIAAPSGRGLYESLGFIVVAEGARFGEPQFVMDRPFPKTEQ